MFGKTNFLRDQQAVEPLALLFQAQRLWRVRSSPQS